MALFTRSNGLRFGIAFLLLGVLLMLADIMVVSVLGTNATSTWTTVKPPAARPLPPTPALVPAPAPREMVEVLVATKDLPVGTVFTADGGLWTTKKVPKYALPRAAATDAAELLGKRLSRAVRADETFNSNDLTQGLALPDGHDLVSLASNPHQGSGFIVPGCRVNVMASIRLDDRLKVFDLLVNVLVVSVNHEITNKNGVYSDVEEVGFALTPKQAKVLALARARGCGLLLALRNPSRPADDDAQYNIYDVIKLLEGGGPRCAFLLSERLSEVAPPPRPLNEER